LLDARRTAVICLTREPMALVDRKDSVIVVIDAQPDFVSQSSTSRKRCPIRVLADRFE
jgi:hypothetical protein